MRRFISLSKWAFLSLLSISLSSCSVKVPDLKVCAVAGVMRAGATCDTTNSHQRHKLNFQEMVEFLEPRPEREIVDPKDSTKKIKLPAKAAAVCLAPESWTANKTFYEQVCKKMGDGVCNAEIKAQIKEITNSVDGIQNESMQLKSLEK